MYSRLRNGFQKPEPDAKEKMTKRASRIVSEVVRRRYCAHLAANVDCTFKMNRACDQMKTAKRNVVIFRVLSESAAMKKVAYSQSLSLKPKSGDDGLVRSCTDI